MSNLLGQEDESGMQATQAEYHKWIAAEETESGITSDRVVIGGFSQGGIMAILAGLTHKTKIGGVFGLSSCLAMRDRFQSLVPQDNPNKDTPIFLGQGDRDPVVRPEWGQMTADILKSWGYNVDFHMYEDLGHSASDEELADLEAYLEARLPKPEGKNAASS